MRLPHRKPRPVLPLPTPTTVEVVHTGTAKKGMRALLAAITVGLAFVISAPFALSSQDLVDWAHSATGLALPIAWSLFVFVALDIAAAVCVGMVVYAAWRGESGGIFGVLVWGFAGFSAFANYRHASGTAARDDDWFFPTMSLAGPLLLEATVRRVRRWVKTSAGRYENPLPHFRAMRWILSLRETWTAYRLSVTEGYSQPVEAITAARIRRGVLPPGNPPLFPLIDRATTDPVPDRFQPLPEPDPTGPVESDRSDQDATGHVEDQPEQAPEPVRSEPDPDPTGADDVTDPPEDPPPGDRRRKVTDEALAKTQQEYDRQRLEGRRMTDGELAPLLGVSTDSARRIRRDKLEPAFLAKHPPVRPVRTGTGS